MTYRHDCGVHHGILVAYRGGFSARTTLFDFTYRLLLERPGVEVAAWPLLYPWSRYGDTDVRNRLVEGGSGDAGNHYYSKTSFLRKIRSRCRSYEQVPAIMFFLYDSILARTLTTKMNVAAKGGLYTGCRIGF